MNVHLLSFKNILPLSIRTPPKKKKTFRQNCTFVHAVFIYPYKFTKVMLLGCWNIALPKECTIIYSIRNIHHRHAKLLQVTHAMNPSINSGLKQHSLCLYGCCKKDLASSSSELSDVFFNFSTRRKYSKLLAMQLVLCPKCTL